jgi:hypothetical protein
MARKCKFNNCEEICGYRKQFCEYHRCNRKRKSQVHQTIAHISPIISRDISEGFNDISSSNIIQEQNLEYERCMQLDMQRIQEIENSKILENAIKLSLEHELSSKKSKLQDLDTIDDKECFIIKFKLPNSVSINHKFHIESTFEDIRNFLDYYFLNNSFEKLNGFKYDIATNFPKIIFTDSYNTSKISDHINGKNILLYIVIQ